MFGERIKALREQSGHSGRKLAALVGVSTGFIHQVELYGKIPSPECIIELAVNLNVPPVELLELAMADQLRAAERKISKVHSMALKVWRFGLEQSDGAGDGVQRQTVDRGTAVAATHSTPAAGPLGMEQQAQPQAAAN